MKLKDIILFPFNGNAKEACSVIEAINSIKPTWNILGFIDDDRDKHNEQFTQYKVLGRKEVLDAYSDAQVLAVPGSPDSFQTRENIINALNLPASRFATVIHPSAQIGTGCMVGSNCLVMANVVLTANTKLASHIVVLPNTVISHDTTIENYTIIGSNVSISGSVSIGKNCYIGTGSRFIQNISVGEKSLIGIGSVVIRDILPNTKNVGNPARRLNED